MLCSFPFAQAHAAVLVQLGQNFTGSTYGVDSFDVPPDSNGAAGPDHFVELINGRFSVYAKTNGARVQTMTDTAFWTSAGVTFGARVLPSDPRLIFDPTVQRWFASAIDFNSQDLVNNRFLLAVSTDADPTQPWQGFAFAADPGQTNFADYPTLGLDANGVYLAAFMFDSAGNELGQNTLVSIPKPDLLANPPTITNRTWFGLLNAASHGSVLQPAVNFDPPTGPEPVLAVGNLGLDFKPHSTLASFGILNGATPAASLTPPQTITVPPYSVPINPPQPSGNDNLDDGDARLSAKVYEVGGILYATHSTEVSNRAAIRWYKIDAATRALLQSGTIAHTNLDLFYPSIAANPSDTVVIGFNGCSTNTFVSCYAVVGDTLNGHTTFGDLLLLKAGLDNYTYIPAGDTTSRWGDYSATCVDPVDPNRFWTIQMYPAATNTWATQITEILTALPTLSIASLGTNVMVCWPGTAIPLQLETASTLSPPDWTPVAQTFSATNGLVCALLPANNPASFFRLRQ